MKKISLLFAFFIIACAGPMGPKGDAGEPGMDGKDGRDGDTIDAIDVFAEQISVHEPSIFNILCVRAVQQEDGSYVDEWSRGTATKISDTQVLSAWHVTYNARQCNFYFSGKTFAIYQSPKMRQTIVNTRLQDVVIFDNVPWTQDGKQLVPVPWADDYHVHEAELVGMLSYPEGFDQVLVYSFGRVNVASFPQASSSQDAIALDLVSWHGSSGGPIFNQAGFIIGILISGFDMKNYDLQFVNALRNVD